MSSCLSVLLFCCSQSYIPHLRSLTFFFLMTGENGETNNSDPQSLLQEAEERGAAPELCVCLWGSSHEHHVPGVSQTGSGGLRMLANQRRYFKPLQRLGSHTKVSENKTSLHIKVLNNTFTKETLQENIGFQLIKTSFPQRISFLLHEEAK